MHRLSFHLRATAVSAAVALSACAADPVSPSTNRSPSPDADIIPQAAIAGGAGRFTVRDGTVDA